LSFSNSTRAINLPNTWLHRWIYYLSVGFMFAAAALRSVLVFQTSSLLEQIFLLLAVWLLAGSSVWFALQRRTARQFASERFRCLFVPFLVGCILFTPLQSYIEWIFRLQVGSYDGSYLRFFFVERFDGWNPTIFGWLGYHLWFLGYLFVDSLLLLPLFEWLKGEAGRRMVLRLARLSQPPGSRRLCGLDERTISKRRYQQGLRYRKGRKPIYPSHGH
jgi:hypothetical protein